MTAPNLDWSELITEEFASAPVGPGGPANTTGEPVSLKDLRSLSDKEKRVIIYARVDYLTVFDTEPRHTEVTFDLAFLRPYEDILKTEFNTGCFTYLSTGKQNTAS